MQRAQEEQAACEARAAEALVEMRAVRREETEKVKDAEAEVRRAGEHPLQPVFSVLSNSV